MARPLPRAAPLARAGRRLCAAGPGGLRRRAPPGLGASPSRPQGRWPDGVVGNRCDGPGRALGALLGARLEAPTGRNASAPRSTRAVSSGVGEPTQDEPIFEVLDRLRGVAAPLADDHDLPLVCGVPD